MFFVLFCFLFVSVVVVAFVGVFLSDFAYLFLLTFKLNQAAITMLKLV